MIYKTEEAIQLLFRRGFLIDKTDCGYVLSDNSANGDREYLNSILCKYNVGHLDDHQIIVIDKPQNVDGLYDLFKPVDQGIGIEECDISNGWPQFRNRAHGIKVPVQWLEANVALYVKALSAAGFMTDACCDGNHHNNMGKLYVRFRTPFDLWHEFLWNEYLGKFFELKWVSETYHLESVYFRDYPKNVCYDILFKAGAYIYENRQLLRTIRLSAASFLSTHKAIRGKNRTKADELENFNIFLERAKPLIAKSSFGKEIL